MIPPAPEIRRGPLAFQAMKFFASPDISTHPVKSGLGKGVKLYVISACIVALSRVS